MLWDFVWYLTQPPSLKFSPWSYRVRNVNKISRIVHRSNTCKFQTGAGTDTRTIAEDLSPLLRDTTAFDATVAHDHIYSLLGLLNVKESPPRFHPSDTEPASPVFHAYTKFIVEKLQSFSVLEWGSGVLLGAPTWIADFSNIEPPHGGYQIEDIPTGKVTFSSDSFERRTSRFVSCPVVVVLAPIADNLVDHMASLTDPEQDVITAQEVQEFEDTNYVPLWLYGRISALNQLFKVFSRSCRDSAETNY